MDGKKVWLKHKFRAIKRRKEAQIRHAEEIARLQAEILELRAQDLLARPAVDAEKVVQIGDLFPRKGDCDGEGCPV